ncbi:MAG: site-specific DNA-methyltransferase, partial [Thermonemataceae bacterium]|nr:site-specific DNA-methyltransferase [Thermonemataceae bacterium]
MSKEQKITTEIKVPNKDLETLKIHFPHCFDKDGNFQFEKFKNNLTEKEINFSTESYGLDWLGKSYARLLASDPATTLLKADETHNALPENANSENLLIKGDNLEVLKHLANAYYEQVKMIYIDPPYNTGSDGFVYNDDRKFTVKELQNLIGVDEEKAKRILSFTKSDSNSHSAWLTFMYPRLYIAKQLLKNDGVIFVSIDDNEVAQLRLLMDEVFGEENFVGQITLVNNPRGRDYGGIAQMHEYILAYSKTLNTEINLLSDKNKIFQYQDSISGFDLRELRNRNIAFNKGNRPNLYYPFYINPNKTIDNGLFEISIVKKEGFIELFPKESQGVKTVWRWGKEKAGENLNVNIAAKAMMDGGFQIVEKYRKEEKMARSVWWDKEDNSEKGTIEVKNIFNGKKIFDFPKSRDVIEKLIEMGANQSDLILDFFAGSGTTADAVMQLNAEDGGNRKFILVQLPEPIDPKKNKTAFDFVKNELKAEPTIFEITKERLVRAAKKINAGLYEKIKKLKTELPTEETKAEIAQLEKCKTQNNFKVFETTPIWEDYNFEAEQFNPQQELFNFDKLTEDDIKALLTTWKTYDGIALTKDLESVDLNGYTAYYGNGRLYLMHKGFTTDSLKSLLEKIDADKHFEPKSIIAFGYHLESKSLREISE